MADIEARLLHYKKYLEKYLQDKSRENDISKILRKLNHLPVTLDHLQSTGIGKAVNSYRKHSGDVGRESKALVAKWKSLVPGVIVVAKPSTIQCETISETSYSAQEVHEEQMNAASSGHRVPYLQSSHVQKSTSGKGLENGKSSDTQGKSNSKHHKNIKVDCDKMNCDDEKVAHILHEERHSSPSKSKAQKGRHHHKKDKDGKHKEKESNSGKKHNKEHHDSSSKKRKAEADSGSHCSKKARKCKEMDGPHTDDGDNDGLSFEDLLKVDEQLLKKQKKRKKVNLHVQDKTSEANSKELLDGSRSSLGDQSSRTAKISSHGCHKERSEKSASSQLKSSNSDSNKMTKKAEFSIPPPPSTQVRLSEVDILGDLPKTNPNYHPLPHVMPKEQDKCHARAVLSEEEFLGTKRNTKTQVYSGKRAVYLQEVPTLYDACLRVLMDNIDNIEHVGGIPADILKPVLMKCTASQLYTLEEYNPHFLGETDYLWEKLCSKEFRNETPDEFESWRELYLRKHDEREARLKRLTSNIAEAFAKKQEPVKKTKLAYVDTTAKPPKHVLRQQIKHGTAGPTKLDALSQLTSHGSQPVKHVVSQNHVESSPIRKRKPVPPMMQKAMKLFKSMRR